MNESTGNFSKGPWIVCRATEVPAGKGSISVGRRFAVYAQTEPEPDAAQAEANARAIAAVPELYEAVELARETILRLTRGETLTAEEACHAGTTLQGALTLADTGRR